MDLAYAIFFVIILDPEAERRIKAQMCIFCAMGIPCDNGIHAIMDIQHTCSATLKGVREVLQNG